MLSSYLRSLLCGVGGVGGVGGGDAATVDDLFQAAMIVAWRRLADFDRSRSFGMWLRGIARNLVLEHARKAAHRLSVDDPRVMAELDARYDSFTSGGRIFGERSEDVLRCLASLPVVMREAMEMVYARGMLLRQIAVALAVAEETIKKRVQRGRVAVAECMRAGGHGQSELSAETSR